MSKKKELIYSLIVMLLWGSLFPVIKIGYAEYNINSTGDIFFFAGIRFLISGAIISLYAFIKDKDFCKSVKQNLLPVLLSGVFAIILHYGFTYSALKMTDSSKTAILKQVGVLFYVCFSFIFFKDDKVTLKKVIGVLIGFSGIIAINTGVNGLSFNIGDALILAASFCTVFSNVISKKVFKNVNPISSTGASQLFGGIVLLLIGKLLGGSMSIKSGGGLLLMAYICTASILSYCIWFTVVKNGELSKLFIIKFAEPAFACVFSAILLGENVLQIQYIIAFLLIGSGIYISSI